MNPAVFELAAGPGATVSPGRGLLAAFVPATADTPALVVAACDPRCDPACPMETAAAPLLAYLRAQVPGAGELRWAVVDQWGRFFQALPLERATLALPQVELKPFPAGTDMEAFVKELGAAGEAGLEMLSAVIEGGGRDPEPPTAREFLEAVTGHGNLPSPGTLFRQVSAASLTGDVRGAAQAVQADPVISATLLKYANSVQFAAARKTASVSDAIVRLGLTQVKRVVFIAEMMTRYRSGSCAEFPYRSYWHNAIATGAAMRGLMERFTIPMHMADEAFTAGLLSGIGWLAVAETYPVLMSRYLAQARHADPITKARAQNDIFPSAIRHVSEAYLAGFDLPETMRAAIAGARSAQGANWFDCLAAAVRAAQGLAPFECLAVPTTIPVPESCREEWSRWQGFLA